MVQTYVFWIHHEEQRGTWRWAGRRDLRAFVKLAGAAGLRVLVRAGPWSHGEARGGGFPDWLEALGANGTVRLRSTDPAFLALARSFFEQQAAQLQGLWWRDGGPIVGVQVSNEYSGPAAYLLAIKALALDVGMCPPYFFVTGWPSPSTPIPPGALIPLVGGYVAEFWSPSLQPAAPGSDYLMQASGASSNRTAPVLGVEIGGGMETAYHRRPVVVPADVSSDVLVRVVTGFSSLGYYVYRGGTNPVGFLSHLEETQASGGSNDLPVRSYDYAAPLSEFGEARAHYAGLRLLHLFLQRWGGDTAALAFRAPDFVPTGPPDTTTLRWGARGNATSALVGVCNYGRLQTMAGHPEVAFRLRLAAGNVTIPSAGNVSVAPGACFHTVVGWTVAGGLVIRHATAQLVTEVQTGTATWTVVLAAAMGVQPGSPSSEVVLDASTVGAVVASIVPPLVAGGAVAFRGLPAPSRAAIATVRTPSGATVSLVVLPREDALSLTSLPASLPDRPARLVIGALPIADPANASALTLRFPGATSSASVSFLPRPASVRLRPGLAPLATRADGAFWATDAFPVPGPTAPLPAPTASLTQAAGPPRLVPIGRAHKAEEPTDADFGAAAVWRIALPRGVQAPGRNTTLVIAYTGDVARLYLNGTLLTDDQATGQRAFRVGLDRYAPRGIFEPGAPLDLKILPLSESSPVYLPSRPSFNQNGTALSLDGLALQSTQDVGLLVTD